MTLGEYLEQWIDATLRSRVASGRLRPSTFDSYRGCVRKHITPVLGSEPLTALRPRAIRKWLRLKLEEQSPRHRCLAEHCSISSPGFAQSPA
ncbi:MAG: N-terminal phage integrase SAM-like domain-containing protein [Actinomycetota bacterium]